MGFRDEEEQAVNVRMLEFLRIICNKTFVKDALANECGLSIYFAPNILAEMAAIVDEASAQREPSKLVQGEKERR